MSLQPIKLPPVGVKAQTTVDFLQLDIDGPVFKVKVWGEKPFAHTRIYKITAKDDNVAAFEGIRRFTAEMEQLAVSSPRG